MDLWTFILCLLLCAPSGVSFAQSWERLESERGATVYGREKKGSGLEELRGVIEIPFSASQVASVMRNIAEHPTFIEEIDRIRVLTERVDKEGAKHLWVYQTTDIPVISDRDVVIRVKTWSEKEKGREVFHSSFRSDTYDKAPKVRDGVVRMPKLSGYWVARPTKDGKSTFFEYGFHAEVGGSVPDFMVHGAQVDNVMGILHGLKGRCQKLFGAAPKAAQ